MPCGKKSFVVDSIRCLDMNLETQSSIEAIEAFMEDPAFIFPEVRLTCPTQAVRVSTLC